MPLHKDTNKAHRGLESRVTLSEQGSLLPLLQTLTHFLPFMLNVNDISLQGKKSFVSSYRTHFESLLNV